MELCRYDDDRSLTGNGINVLISMHPVDRCVYFDKLASSIAADNNCSVYYSQTPDDKYATDLDNIDVVILAITEKYLTWKNSGYRPQRNGQKRYRCRARLRI